MKRLVVVLAGALVAFGCNKASSETSADSSSTAAPRSPAPRGPEAADPLVEADFEEEALRQINGDNLEAELGFIEQEVRKK
jgi:hypothetical protein